MFLWFRIILHTSGAIQKGVPTNVFLFEVVLVNWPATPKSASFTSPVLLNKTFAAVKINNIYIYCCWQVDSSNYK